jgi:hypothetical protein
LIVGIVGSERAKFTPESEAEAKALIRRILFGFKVGSLDLPVPVSEVVSGGCHLGGIDQWAAEIGREMNIPVKEFIPKTRHWTDGYKPRNIRIAERSDVVHCITVDRLPDTYKGMTFALCYHCKVHDHIKSGGCWTMKKAIALGKQGVLHVVKNGTPRNWNSV